MQQKDLLSLMINDIGANAIIWLVLAGVLFGIAFTYAHFWSIKQFIFKSKHFKSTIFVLTFVRLFVFAGALALAAYPNHPAVRMMIFFISFMIGRIGLMRVAKREIAK